MENRTLEQRHGEAAAAWHLATVALDAVDGEIQRGADTGKVQTRRNKIRKVRDRAYTKLTDLTKQMDARGGGGDTVRLTKRTDELRDDVATCVKNVVFCDKEIEKVTATLDRLKNSRELWSDDLRAATSLLRSAARLLADARRAARSTPNES